MISRETLQTQFQNTNVADSTKKTYISRILRIVEGINYDGDSLTELFKQHKKINDFVEGLTDSVSTKKAYYSTITGTIKKLGLDIPEDIKEIYTDLVSMLMETENETKKQNVKSDKQKKNEISFAQMKKKLENYKETQESFYGIKDLFAGKPLLNKDFNRYLKSLMNYLITSLYVYQPPLRLDYWNIVVEDKVNKNASYNHIVIKPRASKIVMVDYKNSNKLGTQVIPVEKKLNDILKKWLKTKKEMGITSDRLVFLPNKDQLLDFNSSNTFKNYLNRALELIMGKKLNVNMLRSIYENELMSSKKYQNMSLAKKEKEHLKLLHTKSTAELHYRKL